MDDILTNHTNKTYYPYEVKTTPFDWIVVPYMVKVESAVCYEALERNPPVYLNEFGRYYQHTLILPNTIR